MKEATQLYYNRIKNFDILPADQAKILAKKAQNGDKESFNQLVYGNLRLVISIAKTYTTNTYMDFLDLVQEGNIGLMRAIEHYDPNKNIHFSTYATYWIKQAIARAISEHSSPARMPGNMWDNYVKISRIKKELIQELNNDPTPLDIAKKVNLTEQQVIDILDYSRDSVSLDLPVGEDQDTFLLDTIADARFQDPATIMDVKNKQEILLNVLSSLDEREKYIIIHRFGLFGNDTQTLETVGKHLGISRERVRQLEQLGLRKLRNPLRLNILKECK